MGVASAILVVMVTVFYIIERVEIAGYTIQFYHKLEQPFKSYCHKNIGIFCIQPNGMCTTSVHQMGHPFIFNGGLKIFKYL